MKSKSVSIISGIIFFVISMIVSNYFIKGSGSFDEQLQKSASELNKTLPMMIDSETQLTSTIAGPGKKFSYFYKLVNMENGKFDSKVFKEVMTKQILNMVKTQPELESLRNKGVVMHYSYRDRNDNSIMNLEFGPKDYN